jgi:O-antigen ligase
MTTSISAAPVETGPVTRRRETALPVMVGITVALLPILVPAGPGNTAVADVGMAASIAIGLLWLTRERLPLALPYAVGVALLLIGGALAATVAGAPLTTATVLAQDVFLLLWAATLALGRYDPAIIAAATTTWCRVAVTYSAIVLVAYVIGFGPLSGVTAADGVRASYTFADPNLAGNYLVTSLFMMVACKRPRAASTRRLSYVLVLVAIGFTGSNGAMITLLIGCAVCVAASQYRKRGPQTGLLSLIVAAVVAAALLVLVFPRVDFEAVREQASNSVPLLRDSVGRSGASENERKTIFEEGITLFFEGNAAGYGPARTKATLQATQAPYVKEAHSDYLAVLLERGIVGATGLLLLAAAVAGRCWRLLNGRLPPDYAEIVPRAWLLIVIAPMMATAALFYEVLHFRHLWTWLGIVAALALVMQDHSEHRRRNRLLERLTGGAES